MHSASKREHLAIDRRRFIEAGIAAGVSFLAGAGAVRLGSRRGPNVIVIVSDALRADIIGAQVNGVTVMPNIERLAERGTCFTRCIAPSSWTLLAVPGILSSTAPLADAETYSRNTAFFPEGAANAAEVFADAGMMTTAVIKNPWLYQGPEIPPEKRKLFARGFQAYHVPILKVDDNPLYGLMGGFKKDYSYEDAARATDQALNVLRMHRLQAPEQPFFMYLHYMDTHEPYQPPERYAKKFLTGDPIPGAPDINLIGVIRTLDRQRGTSQLEEDQLPVVARARQMYTACANYVDDELSRLFNYLEAERLVDNTIIAFTSDHGEEFAEHGWIGHGRTLFRELLEVPLVLAGPSVARRAVFEDMVASVDIIPALVRMAGVDAAEMPFEGDAEAIIGQAAARDIISTTVQPGGAPVPKYVMTSVTTRTGKKFIRTAFCDKAGKVERTVGSAYDHRRDPGETNDVAESAGEFCRSESEAIDAVAAARSGKGGMTLEVGDDVLEAVKSLGYLN